MNTPFPKNRYIPLKERKFGFFSRVNVSRIFLFLGMWILLVGLVITGDFFRSQLPEVGQIAPRAIYARTDFPFTDFEATHEEQNQLLSNLGFIYRLDPLKEGQTLRQLAYVFDRVKTLEKLQRDNDQFSASLQALLDYWNDSAASPNYLTESDVLTLMKMTNKAVVHRGLREIVAESLSKGIISHNDYLELTASAITHKRVNIIGSMGQLEPFEKDRWSVLTTESASKSSIEKLTQAFSPSYDESVVLTKILAEALRPNLVLRPDVAEMERLKEKVKTQIEPKRREYRTGEALVQSGQLISAEKSQLLKAHDEAFSQLRSPSSQGVAIAGKALLVFLLLAIGAAYLQMNHRHEFNEVRSLALICLLGALNLFVSKLILVINSQYNFIHQNAIHYFLPTAFAPVLTAILLTPAMGIFIAFFLSIFTAVIAGNSISCLLAGLVTSCVGIFFTHHAHKRSQLLKAGLFMGLANALAVLAIACISQPGYQTLWQQLWAALACGLAIGFVASGGVSLFEFLFNITTDITFLELSDLNHPLLKQMVMEAPGTYHHSLVVANLSENAAEAIGANPIMCRVCSYFHDIGKLERPEYYVENQANGENPHDRLSPDASFKIIVSHVKDGVALAKKYKLNRHIVDAIETHHGTSLVYFFYKKAQEQELEARKKVQKITPLTPSEDFEVREEDYRYPGPKPRTRECAIMSLADPVESASRTLVKPTPQKVEAMVKGIISSRFADGQLSECDLSLRDLSIIAERFTFTLISMNHSRIAYPKEDEEKNSEDKTQSGAGTAEGSKPAKEIA